METKVEKYRIYNTIDLIDNIFNLNLDSNTFIDNEKIINELGNKLNDIKYIKEGHILLSITNNLDTTLILIHIEQQHQFCVYNWKIKEKIEKPLTITVHELCNTNKLTIAIDQNEIEDELFISSSITETINGYSLNLEKGKNFSNRLISDSEVDLNILNIISNNDSEQLKFVKKIKLSINKYLRSQETIIRNYISKFNNIPFSLNIKNNIISNFIIGKISNIQVINGRRFFTLETLNYYDNTLIKKTVTISNSIINTNNANSSKLNNLITFTKRSPSNISNFENIPYNFIDDGRLLLAVPTINSYIVFLSEDPKIDPNYIENFKLGIQKSIPQIYDNIFDITGTIIEGNINLYYDNYKGETLATPIQTKLNNLKKMFDEYNFIVKKEKAIGKDINITEKLKFNFNSGTLIYNDFSISINDEYIKSYIYKKLKIYAIEYYRKKVTEEEILQQTLVDFFCNLNDRLNSTKSEDVTDITIILNTSVIINICGQTIYRKKHKEDPDDTKKASGKLFYINNQRFNKNEVLTIIKELTCYRNQSEADLFIRNVGKLGLSVYIGITSGYEIKEINDKKVLFKFKKLKGRSNYQLLLDNTTINLTGKKLINDLYQNFVGIYVPRFNDKIKENIFNNSDVITDYIKYRSLIFSTYEKYKQNAKIFLDKKVVQLDGKYVKYNNLSTRKTLDAIFLTGQSKRNYILAYDDKNSYVFIDPEKESDELYKNGKYICMIDQSNIKSNISYDTIISKLMALKNDSMVAQTIYNLKEEL